MTHHVPPLDEDPLIAALRMENAHLLDSNRRLANQLSAAHAAQAEFTAFLRLTSPLRRVQEKARLRKQRRRRRRSVELGPESGSELAVRPHTRELVKRTGGAVTVTTKANSGLEITAAQESRYPLLARTRQWQTGHEIEYPEIRPLRRGCAGKVLVIAHVYYPEIWPELAERIKRIPVPYDVVATLVEGDTPGLVDEIVTDFPGAIIETQPNRGRDIWPLVHVAELGLIGDYDAVLKVHTKRSPHRLDGDAWRERLLDGLCPSPEGIGLILELLRRDPKVGMVAPAGAVLGREFWGANAALIDALAARTGVPVDPASVWFPGGSMFWTRPGPLNRLRNAGLTIEDFEHESVFLDRTTAHAVERFLGALVVDADQIVIGADEVAGKLARARREAQPDIRLGSKIRSVRATKGSDSTAVA
jgi:hypothetical protein